jgi:hypothetical protein
LVTVHLRLVRHLSARLRSEVPMPTVLIVDDEGTSAS